MPKEMYRFRIRTQITPLTKKNLKRWPEMERNWNESTREHMREQLNDKGIYPAKMYCWLDHNSNEKICDLEIRDFATDKFVFVLKTYYRDWTYDKVEPPATTLNLNAHRKLPWKR